MLRSVLSPEECAQCRFCCSFRRTSLWETPLFYSEELESIRKEYPNARFKTLDDNSVTVDLDGGYLTDDPDEEVLCPFNKNGCILNSEQKPFDCSIWPLRIMRKDKSLVIALTPTCPAIGKKPLNVMRELVSGGLWDIIKEKARLHPEMIKPYREGFPILAEYEEREN